MSKELELAKKLALLGWIYRQGYISDSEYSASKYAIMNAYGIISFMG